MINKNNEYEVDLKDEVVRGAIITQNKEVLWPNPNPPMLDASKTSAAKTEHKAVKPQ